MADDKRGLTKPRAEREPSAPIEFHNPSLVPEGGKDIKESAAIRFTLLRGGKQAVDKATVKLHWAKQDAPMHAPVRNPAGSEIVIFTNQFGQGSCVLNNLGGESPEVIGITLQHSFAGMVTIKFPWVASATGKSEKKNRRLKVLPEGNQDSMNVKYPMEVLTYDDKGEKPAAGIVEFAASENISLVDQATNTLIAANVKFFSLNVGTNGRLLLEVQYSGLECRISFRHTETDERVDKILAFL